MGEADKRYEAFQIFEQIQSSEEKPVTPVPKDKDIYAGQDMYYEIEYDACPLPGVGKFVLKSGSPGEIPPAPPMDEIRDVFNRMRNIARENRRIRFNAKPYDRRVQEENAKIFYLQGMFMKDFEDDYEKVVPYSTYFPDYQMMGYDQLRTYFTWRTRVRQGDITDVSLSYAFIYIYELLNNIGTESPQDALDKLLVFWDAFRVYDKTVDKYVLRWLKDYHVYYELGHSFLDFIRENNLEEYYPRFSSADNHFDLYYSISKYDIRKSAFYKDNVDEVRDCFNYVMDSLKGLFSGKGLNLDDFIFQPTKRMPVWTPFNGALFYSHLQQRDRRVILSDRNVYVYKKNQWTFSTMITTDSGRRFLGYCFKQIESVLRKAEKYKYKLSASTDMLGSVMEDKLKETGISLEAAVTGAVMEFYREANRTVVRVDREALEKIRRESLITQERLIVPEEAEEECRERPEEDFHARKEESLSEELAQEEYCGSMQDEWEGLREALTEVEKRALSVLLQDRDGIRKFADEQNVMLEVLMDGINGKAMDYIGDSLLDDDFMVYEDYLEQAEGMVEGI